MKSHSARFRDWCSANSGVFTFLALLVAVASLYPFKYYNPNSSGALFPKLLQYLAFKVSVPIYLLILILLISLLYAFRHVKMRKAKLIPLNILVGSWSNEWDYGDGRSGKEKIVIDEGYQCMINRGGHQFNIEDIKFDLNSGAILFTKVAVKDSRKLMNHINTTDYSLLIRTEKDLNTGETCRITYRRT